MMDAMWIWGAIGLILLGVEMATGTFYVLWFGVAALCMAATMWWLPSLAVAIQFGLFAALSLGSLAAWRLNYKKTSTHSRVGQAQGEEIGRIGTVTETVGPRQMGKIVFTQGVMGSRDWVAVADEVIEIGADASVLAVEGNALRLKKVS